MTKWEIRFQRFAISFRPSAKVLMRSPPREAEGLLRGYAARGNEKFHIPPTHPKQQAHNKLQENSLNSTETTSF
jgi:hypothetical protein